MAETAKPFIASGREFGNMAVGILAQYDAAAFRLLENNPAYQPPETHVSYVDLFHVISGKATFRFGGTLDDHQFRKGSGGQVDKDELVGVDIIGGQEVQLIAGDWFWLPPMTPHQHFEDDPNTQLLVVKIPVQSKEKVGPTRVPTQWETKGVVKEGYMRQYDYFRRLVGKVRNVEGDFVECGLGEGNTFGMLAHLIGSNDWAGVRTLRGFDSFEGWPEPTEYDESPRHPKKGEWTVPREMIERVLSESGVRENYPELDIEIVPGFVGDTLPNVPRDRKIAFLHLDLDLYNGYHDALKNLWDLVSPGGIVALDEYREFPHLPEYENGKIEKWPGCTKAVNDFVNSRGLPLPIYDAQARKYYMLKQAA